MSLVTLNRVKDYLEINSNTSDARLANIINSVTTAFQNYCGREFIANNYTEYHDGGVPSIFVDNLPINNVNVVAEYDGNTYSNLSGPNADGSLPDGVGNSSTVLQYMFYEDTGEIRRITDGKASPTIDLGNYSFFNNYPRGVKIIYGGGFLTVPEDLQLAVLDYIKIVHKNEQGSDSFSFEGQNKNSFPLSNNYPKHIKRILDFYRIL